MLHLLIQVLWTPQILVQLHQVRDVQTAVIRWAEGKQLDKEVLLIEVVFHQMHTMQAPIWQRGLRNLSKKLLRVKTAIWHSQISNYLISLDCMVISHLQDIKTQSSQLLGTTPISHWTLTNAVLRLKIIWHRNLNSNRMHRRATLLGVVNMNL